jgi:hypothetical protein
MLSIMTCLEFIYYLSTSILSILIIGGFIWFVISLFRVYGYEKGINKLYIELEDKIDKEKKRPAPMCFIKGRIEKLKTEYEPKIKELERKRQFILDKLPFIK